MCLIDAINCCMYQNFLELNRHGTNTCWSKKSDIIPVSETLKACFHVEHIFEKCAWFMLPDMDQDNLKRSF